jgi:ketosteroid isomerase-like protein
MSRPEYYGNPAGLTGDVEIVRGVYAAFAARDVEAVIAHATPDCELHFDGTARTVERDGPYRGHEGVREYFADVERAWDELVLHADDIRVVPGSVIVMGQVEVRRGELRQRRAVLWTWRLRDGLVSAIRVSDMGEIAG